MKPASPRETDRNREDSQENAEQRSGQRGRLNRLGPLSKSDERAWTRRTDTFCEHERRNHHMQLSLTRTYAHRNPTLNPERENQSSYTLKRNEMRHCRNETDVTSPVLIQTLPRNRGFPDLFCAFNCPERIASLVTTRQRGPTRRDAENLRQPCRRLRKLPDRLANTNPERTRNRRRDKNRETTTEPAETKRERGNW